MREEQEGEGKAEKWCVVRVWAAVVVRVCGTPEVVTVPGQVSREPRRRAGPSLSQDVSGGGRVCVWLLQSLHSLLVILFFRFDTPLSLRWLPSFSWLPWTGHGRSGPVGPPRAQSAASQPCTTKIGSVASLLEVV